LSRPFISRAAVRVLGLAVVLCGLAACGGTGTRPDAGAAMTASPGDAADPGLDVPAPLAAAYARAVAALEAGDLTEAEFEFEQLVLEAPEFPGPYVNLAIVHLETQRELEAEQLLQQALQLDPAHAAANNQLGMLRRRQGRFAEAEAAYRAAIAADPAYALACHNLGVLLDLYLKRGEEALEYYECYQNLQAVPDERVARWIIDLKRRLGVSGQAARVAPEDAS
jgi:tetratricopeptide (TPR) repeat protein